MSRAAFWAQQLCGNFLSAGSGSRIRRTVRLVGYNVLVAALLLIPIEIGLRLFGSEFVLTPPRIEYGYPNPVELERDFRVDPELLWVRRQYADTVAAAADWHPSIVFMGDSCTEGMGDGRYSDELRSLVAARDPSALSFVNLGVSGWSSWSGLQQLQRDVLPMRPKAITIYFGWNDHWEHFGLEDKDAARFLKEPHWLRTVQLAERAVVALKQTLGYSRYRVPLPNFRANLRRMVRIAKDNDIIPILLTAPTSHQRGHEPATLSERWLTNLDDLVPLHRRYVQAVRDVAVEEDAPLIDLYEELNQLPQHERERLFKDDGVHSTPEGYRRIAELIYDHLLRTGLYQRIFEGEPLEERLQERLDNARLMASGGFDVWLHGKRLLYYVKDHCHDPEERFFTHVVPVDPNDLPEGRKESGFDNLDFQLMDARLDFMPRCVAARVLPDYAIATIQTGQFRRVGENHVRSWEATFRLQPASD